MKFIEVTDRFGEKSLVNFDRVESVSECKEDNINTKLFMVNDNKNISIYVQETYEQIKEMLNVR